MVMRLVGADSQTGKLPDIVLDELQARFPRKADINVYDYGATDVSSMTDPAIAPSSQNAIDRAVAAAEKLVVGETRVWISIPYGAIKGTITVQSPFICVTGPGSLVEGQLVFQPPATGQQLRFHSVVFNMGFRPLNASVNRGENGIRVVAGASIEIMSCRFRDMPKAVHLDSWADTTGQQNKTIDVHHNQMTNVDYGLYAPLKGANTWDTHADSKFNENVVRLAYVSHVWVGGADGFDVHGNTLFHVGRDSTDLSRRNQKEDSIYFGPRSNFLKIGTNQIFEAGRSGIFLDRVTDANVVGNTLAWCGQNLQVPAIRLVTSSTSLTAAILIDANIVEECTHHGIGISGDGNAGNITITDSNVIRLIGDSARNVYRGDSMGNGPLVTNDIARIFVASTVTVVPRLTITQMPRGSRNGVVSIKGMYSSARSQPFADNYETTINLTKTVAQGTATTVGVLRSAGDNPSETTFVGLVTVVVKNTTANFVGRYEFTAASNGTNKSVQNLRTAGSVSAITDGTTPAFVFTIASSGSSVIATPQGNTAGTFEFTVTATGYLQTSYTQAEFNGLQLITSLSTS
ncbi:hypothetical protein EDF38_0154 [Frigoribacterium sp. PhB160]|uniref:hypothetical protein n=1 Tax=Frigoribacterium sp. PhB160 TaxID=2485192 RepID=UPI000F4739D7|nr:hypothetical protein [Frigoribacterium sp. PhB160]ROS61075.1 hypothetical protein EDF38_0154 [Frigoribacterium sp. PhB160]